MMIAALDKPSMLQHVEASSANDTQCGLLWDTAHGNVHSSSIDAKENATVQTVNKIQNMYSCSRQPLQGLAL